MAGTLGRGSSIYFIHVNLPGHSDAEKMLRTVVFGSYRRTRRKRSCDLRRISSLRRLRNGEFGIFVEDKNLVDIHWTIPELFDVKEKLSEVCLGLERLVEQGHNSLMVSNESLTGGVLMRDTE